MADDEEVAHGRRNVGYAAAILVALAAVAAAPGLLADAPDAAHPGGAPAGFWLAEQGAVLALAALSAVHTIVANALDRRRDA
jgi:putative solute:sodium symporter small subunit